MRWLTQEGLPFAPLCLLEEVNEFFSALVLLTENKVECH
jgi:hypothetical protein